jgi:hypothetical protein
MSWGRNKKKEEESFEVTWQRRKLLRFIPIDLVVCVCVCAPSPSRSLGTAWRPPLHHLLWYAPARVDVGTRAWIYGWMPNKPRQPTDFPS